MTVDMQQEMQKVAYTTYAKQFNLRPEWLGKTFEHKGRKFTVAGLNVRTKRFPVVTKEGSSFNAEFFRMLMTGDKKTYEDGLEKKQEQELQKARQTYLKFAGNVNGLEKRWLDMSFVHGKHQYLIVGLKFGRTRTNIVTQRDDWQVFDWPADTIIKKMKVNKKAA